VSDDRGLTSTLAPARNSLARCLLQEVASYSHSGSKLGRWIANGSLPGGDQLSLRATLVKFPLSISCLGSHPGIPVSHLLPPAGGSSSSGDFTEEEMAQCENRLVAGATH
jgi:hypothetical protein